MNGPVPTGLSGLVNVTGSSTSDQTCFGTILISPNRVNAAAPGSPKVIETVFASVAWTALR